MATSGTMLIKSTDHEGEHKAILYRCCDFFSETMKDLIKKAFDAWHNTLTDHSYAEDQCDARTIRAIIFAEEWQDTKTTKGYHLCITPYELIDYEPSMTLDVTQYDKWIFEYRDYDENDKEITVKEVLTKDGWALIK